MESKNRELLKGLLETSQITKEAYDTEIEAMENVKDFFDNEIDVKDFVLHMRRLKHVLVVNSFKEENEGNKEWTKHGHYWLVKFLEKLDPILH